MKKSRSHYVVKNASISLVIQAVMLVLQFVLQRVFIQQLGTLYVGTNGLIQNILVLLAFSDLGIGVAITYSLYKPIAENDEVRITGLVNFIRKIYAIISTFIFVAGFIFLPFLPHLIKGEKVANLSLIFMLFILNTAQGYLFGYNRTVLTAFQRDYVNQINTLTFTTVQIVFQIIVLFVFKNYLLYLMILNITTFLSNLFITRRVKKDYTFLKKYKAERPPKETLAMIKRNVREILGNKLGWLAINGTDNLLISAFIGLTDLAFYSNYNLVVSGVRLLQTSIVNSTMASVGNLGTEQDSNLKSEVYKTHYFVNYVMTLICSAMMLGVFTPFITLWVGHKFVLVGSIMSVIVLNFYLQQLRNTANTFMFAFGALRFQGIKSVVETSFNLGLSLFLITQTKLGIAAPLLGTIVTNIIINSWFEASQVYKQAIKLSVKKILIYQYSLMILGLIILGINYTIFDYLWIGNSFTTFIYKGIATFLLNIAIVFVLFYRSSEMQQIKRMVMNLFKR